MSKYQKDFGTPKEYTFPAEFLIEGSPKIDVNSTTENYALVEMHDDLAQFLLRNNKQNRKTAISSKEYRRLKKIFERANPSADWFPLLGEAMAMDCDGLFNGAHRLTAWVAAKKPRGYCFRIVWGLPAKARAAVDAGKSRSPKDKALTQGINISTEALAAIRIIASTSQSSITINNHLGADMSANIESFKPYNDFYMSEILSLSRFFRQRNPRCTAPMMAAMIVYAKSYGLPKAVFLLNEISHTSHSLPIIQEFRERSMPLKSGGIKQQKLLELTIRLIVAYETNEQSLGNGEADSWHPLNIKEVGGEVI